MSPSLRRDAGIALLAALWLVVLVIGALGTLLLPLRTARLQARNAITASVARQEAASGLAHAARLLGDAFSAEASRPRDARDVAMRFREAQDALAALGPVIAPGGGTYELDLLDESARLPVNRASEAEIQRLLVGLGLTHLAAASVAAAIADWMDPDDLHRLHGAEWDDHYSKVPGARRPANGPFSSVGELRHVRGVDDALHRRLADVVTVVPDARVNLNSAPEAVIAALPGLDGAAARQLVAARRAGRVFATPEEVAGVLGERERERLGAGYADFRRMVAFVPATYRIVSTGRPPGQGHAVRLDATVAVNGDRVTVLRIAERRWE